MAINFPDSPSVNDTHTVGDRVWNWNGTYWTLKQNASTYSASDTAPSSPDGGDLWYESDTGNLYVYYGSVWIEVGHATDGGTALADADGDTMIQVEEGADDDTIRFDTAGSERMVVAADGKVGIGTTSPTETLHINGSIKNDSWAYLGSVNSSGLYPDAGTHLAVGWNETGGGRDITFWNTDTAGGGTSFQFNQLTGVSTDANLFTIRSNGQIGIGTADPTGPLHLMAAGDGVDQLKISSTGGTTAEYGFLGASAAGDYMRYGYWTGAGFGSHFFEGKVGIGTTTPAYPLTVSDGSSAGMLQFDPAGLRIGSNHDGYEFNIVGGIPDGTSMGGQIRLGAASRGDSDLNVIQFLQNGAERLRIDNASGGGIACGLAGTRIDRGWANYPSLTVLRDSSTGVSNVTYNEFRVHGASGTWAGGSGADFSVNFRIDGSTYSSSDSRRKTNVENIAGALASVNAIQGVSFNTLNSEGTEEVSTTMGGKRYGFIAQDLSVVAPNAVIHYEDEDEPEDNGWCNAYSVDYGGMTPLLVEAIKELTARIETLEAP